MASDPFSAVRSGFETTWLDNVAMSAATGPRGDIDGNGVVESDDVSVFVAVLLSADANPAHVARSDLNCDGIVDGLDVQLFVTAIISP